MTYNTQRRVCVIGDPVVHSRSPIIHNHWLSRHHIKNATYLAHHVPQGQLDSFFDRLRKGEFIGANVTLPHKEQVLQFADTVSETAKAIGAANTLVCDLHSGQIHADNTDAYGFAAHLDQQAPAWRTGKKAIIVGAGGASRALIYACFEAEFDDIVLINRSEDKARTLAQQFGAKIRVNSFASINNELSETDLLVNATSLGMSGKNNLEIDFGGASKDLIVNDIVYVPLETGLLQSARHAGLQAVDGLGMLLHQAVPGFNAWFGIRPEVDETLRNLIVRDLG